MHHSAIIFLSTIHFVIIYKVLTLRITSISTKGLGIV